MQKQESQEDTELFNRIKMLTQTARSNWLIFLAYLSFVGVTLMGVQDVDFFIPERETMLPLIGVSVPTSMFFYIAPAFGALLYIHLHLYLLKLWRALAEIPAAATPQGAMVSPWIVSDMVLTTRPGFSHTYPLRTLAFIVAFLSIFLAGPAVLAAFWWRSMPKHDELLTIVACGVPLFFSVLTGVESWRAMRRGEAEAQSMPLKIRLLWTSVLIFLSAAGILTTEGILTERFLRSAQLKNAVFVETPKDWLPWDEAEQVFRRHWCEKQGIVWLACGSGPLARDEEGIPLPAPDHLAYQRRLWCSKVVGKDQGAKDCAKRFKKLDSAYTSDWGHAREKSLQSLPNRDLSELDLRKANLSFAQMNGADLSHTRMEGAELGFAQMEGVEFFQTRMKGAGLLGTRMEGAKLQGAGLEGAFLLVAKLDGALLESVLVDNSTVFDGASFFGAALRLVDFSKAPISVMQANSAFGDVSVDLPDGVPRPSHWPDWYMSALSSLFYREWDKWQASPSAYVPPPKPE